MNENPTFYEFSNRVKRETLQTRGSFFPLDRRDEYIYIDCVIRTGILDIVSRNKEIKKSSFSQRKKKYVRVFVQTPSDPRITRD